MALPALEHESKKPSTRPLIVAVVGNPNTGKTTLFNALAGMRQRVGNYPGVTVEKKHGRCRFNDRDIELVDLPGTYSLAPRSPDEMVTVDLLLGTQPGEARPDVILSIVDASNLERNLYLTTQLLELGVPVVVALNMIDLAESKGRKIDVERLHKQLGVRVVPIQANKKRGFDPLRDAILAAASDLPPRERPAFPPAFIDELGRIRATFPEAGSPDFVGARLLLDVGGYTETRLYQRFGSSLAEGVQQARLRLAAVGSEVPGVEARTRYAWIRERVRGCVELSSEPRRNWSDPIDKVLTHKISGTLIFLGMMFLVFQSIFTWATPLMDWIGQGRDWVGNWVKGTMTVGPLRSLIVEGIIQGVGSVIVFLPQIVILFGFIAILEDCGYMARAAFLMDKIMARCGLSGKSFIPLLSSFACAIPGVMATRVIEDRRDRLATILVAPLMSCSARLPLYFLLTGAFLTTGYPWWLPGLTVFGLYLLGIVVAPLVALALKRTVLRGDTPIFLMELPPYKMPSLGLVLHRMYDRGMAFIRRAGTLICASMVIIWALLYFPSTGTDEAGRAFDYDRETDQLDESIANAKGQLETLEKELAAMDATAEGATARVVGLKDRIKQLTETVEPVEDRIHHLKGEWKRRTWLGQFGKWIEPAVEPLGWDWRIGMAAVASFPAREVIVGTMGIIYDVGDVDPGEVRAAVQPGEMPLGKALQAATWEHDASRKIFTIPVALSLLVFFALCCQCVSTLVVIRRETNSWRWPVFTFVYMTVLAYVGALVTYQVGTLLG